MNALVTEFHPWETEAAWRLTLESWLVCQGLITIRLNKNPKVSTNFPKSWSHHYLCITSSPIYQRVGHAANQLLNQAMENTLKLLEANRTHSAAASKALLAKNRLYGNDLQQLLPPLNSVGGKNLNAPTQNLEM